ARNDAAALPRTLAHLARLPGIEGAKVIGATAGDVEGTVAAAAGLARLLWPGGSTPAQLTNPGAAAASSRNMLSPHSASVPRAAALALTTGAVAESRAVGGGVEHLFAEPVWSLRAITWINRVRYRLAGNYYGDQGIFVRATVFRTLGGYRDLTLME